MKTNSIPFGRQISNNVVLNTNNESIEVLDSIAIYEHVCKRNGCRKVLTLNLVGETPAHKKGWELVKKRDLVTVGISIGNGYFSRERVEIILMGMASYFSNLIVVVPDLPAMHTYRGLGCDEHQAMERVKRHMQDINRYYRRISELIESTFHVNNMKMLTWSEHFFQEKPYKNAYSQAIEIYHSNSDFRESILRNTERYILARLEEQDVQQLGGMRRVVEKAAHYLLEEMAFHAMFHTVLEDEPIFSYYKDLELVPNYLNGTYGPPPNSHVGWIVYNIIDSEKTI